MKIMAAVLWEQGAPLSVEEVELDGPRAGEVLVELRAAGVCHSDLHSARGEWPARTPLVLGHEGAGVVREVGEGVTRVREGDRVVFCWAPACGACPPCGEGRPVLCDRLERTTYRNRLPGGGARLRARGRDVAHYSSTACFADYAVVAEEGVVAVPHDVPFDVLATLGCAVVTGVGAVRNAARPEAGASAAVVGVGGVGLNVVQGAALAGCSPIVALDVRSSALRLARAFGATDTVDAGSDDAIVAVRDLTGGRGADFVFDTVGSPTTVARALELARKGGTVVVTGLAHMDARASIPTFLFVMQEKRLIGSLYGSGRPVAEIPGLADLYLEGRLKLRELITHTYRLDEINDAFAAMTSGSDARGVVVW
jgi:S-(hydroxymethyl)glutathione dehydrogenase / alcohol dehydrogenase